MNIEIIMEGYRYEENGIVLDPRFSICFRSRKPKELQNAQRNPYLPTVSQI
jgi:hypothetical protein